jgi:AraC family transcriptional regulator, regulatory protein of adaptative response / methylated-DNA-[protein]-cysteine methyltransferase
MAKSREIAAPHFPGEEDRWVAVVRRDRRANGQFYFSVRTTGVYCRPSCPSRRARRQNVSFHATREEAERAGFRACKRCRPNEISLAERRAAAVARACGLIEAADDPPALDELADSTGMSRFYFHRIFKTVTGVTPRAYVAALRAQRVREELPRSRTVTEAIYGAGFSSSGRFYATAAEVLGMTPTKFRSGGNRASIRFAVGECSLGSILVAATDRGLRNPAWQQPSHAGARSSSSFPEGASSRRPKRIRAVGGKGGWCCRGAIASVGSATRCPWHCFSATRLASTG